MENMTEEKTHIVDPVPPGYRTVTPYIVAQDAGALIDFVREVFGGEQTFRSIGGAGGVHAEVRVEDCMLMIGGGGEGLAWRGESKPGAFHIYVRDCDAVYERALEAGATSINPPQDQPYGERSGGVVDGAGNYWYIATYSGGDYVRPDATAIMPYLHPVKADPVLAFLQQAFGATQLGRFASPDGVVHHAIAKIGTSYIEMGEAHGKYQPMHSMFYLYVPDCDALYQQAVTAGATTIYPPTDHDYGDRGCGVKDAFGNEWYIATHIKDIAR